MKPRLRVHRGFVAFWAASTVSDFGSAITGLALQLLVLTTLGGSTVDVGLVSSGRWIAYAAVGLVAGSVLDRVRRRPVLVITDLGQGLSLGLVCVLAVGGWLSLPLLIGVMVVFGLCSLFNDAAYQAITPQLVPPPLLTRANTRLQQSTAAAQTTGPALAGVLVRLIGPPLAIGLDAVSYLLSAGVLTRLPEPATDRPSEQGKRLPRPTLRAETVEGLRWVYRHRLLAPLALTTHAWFVCWAILNTVQIAYATGPLGLSAVTIGLCLAVGGVVTLISTTLSERVADRFGVGRTILFSYLGYAPGVVCLLLAPAADGPGLNRGGIVALLAAQVIIGAAFGLDGPASISFRQAITPDRLQGRSNAINRSVNRGVIVLAAPLGGLVATRFGAPAALIVAAVGFALVSVAYALTPMSRARLPSKV